MNWDEIISTFCATGLKVDRPFVIWWRPAVQWVWDWKPCARWPGCYRRIQPTNSNWPLLFLFPMASEWRCRNKSGGWDPRIRLADLPQELPALSQNFFRIFGATPVRFIPQSPAILKTLSPAFQKKKLRREDFNSAEVTIINTVFNNRIHSFNSLPPSIHFGFSSTS